MKTAAACRRALAMVGLHVVVEKDETLGYEYLVEDMSGTLFRGYHEGSYAGTLNAVLAIPAIASRLSGVPDGASGALKARILELECELAELTACALADEEIHIQARREASGRCLYHSSQPVSMDGEHRRCTLPLGHGGDHRCPPVATVSR